MIAGSFAMMSQYAWWRITETLPAPAANFEYALALVFLIAELVGIATAALSLVFLTRTRDRSPDADANAGWLSSLENPPPIDVLICSYNEEKEILERTIVGALGMDYPNFRVWMLDDNRRAWVKTLCAELGCHYLSRSDNAHAKAGNINHALKQIAVSPDPPEFVSILDADFVPTPQFLKRAMSLFRNPAIGVVQTPQHFVNPDPIQINLGATKFWPDEQRFFFDVVLPAKDAWSAAFCCGTSSIVRMQPLMKIGGFPTDSVDRGLSLKSAAQGEEFSHSLSERAADLWARPRRPERIHHAAESMVSRLHADRARAQRPALIWLAACVHRSPVPDRSIPQLDRGSSFASHRSDHPARFAGLRSSPLPRFALRARDALPAVLAVVRSRGELARLPGSGWRRRRCGTRGSPAPRRQASARAAHPSFAPRAELRHDVAHARIKLAEDRIAPFVNARVARIRLN